VTKLEKEIEVLEVRSMKEADLIIIDEDLWLIDQ